MSHDNDLNDKIVVLSFIIFIIFDFINCLKQSKCKYFIVPAHLQGFIKGLSSVYSSDKQILQVGL